MSVVDPIADILTRIRNAQMALHDTVSAPLSKAKADMVAIFKDEGYVQDFEINGSSIDIRLKYHEGKPAFSGLKRVSKPGRRVYVGKADIPAVQNGLGVCILSTSQGIVDGAKAKELGIGGELLCEIW
ncbi:30S ribosomal protein S8 [Desulfoplanes sp.]